MQQNNDPQAQHLTFGPVTFYKLKSGPYLRMVWKPGYSHITGHVLDIDDVRALHKLTGDILKEHIGALGSGPWQD